MTPNPIFIIDCPLCKARVAAEECGRAEHTGWIEELDEPFRSRLLLGKCPSCKALLVGEAHQLDFKGYDAETDRWSDVVRVYPQPPKTFLSRRVPRVVKDSLTEADRCLQTGANIAACVMLGRALEALCRDLLSQALEAEAEVEGNPKPEKAIMLGSGIRQLKERGMIDDRLFKWSEELQGFRNLAAHPEDISISREDASDLQSFVYAIVEYIYDLADKYDEFKARTEARAAKEKSWG
jgi:hypothetical protein